MEKLVKFKSPVEVESQTTWQDLISDISGRIERILKGNPNAIVPMPIKDRNRKIVGWRYEITREVALSIMNFIENVVVALGGNVRYDKEITKDEGEFFVKASLEIEVPNSSSPKGYSTIRKTALGGCTIREMVDDKSSKVRMEHDALGTAETRAMKRLIEEVIGEDRINKIISEVKNGYGAEVKRPSEITGEDVRKSLKVFNDMRKKRGKDEVEIEKVLEYLKSQGKISDVKELSEYSKAELVAINNTLIAWTNRLAKEG